MDLGPNLCILCDSASAAVPIRQFYHELMPKNQVIDHPQIIPSQVGGHFVHQTLRLALLNPKKKMQETSSQVHGMQSCTKMEHPVVTNQQWRLEIEPSKTTQI
jgi:hypothetical protein